MNLEEFKEYVEARKKISLDKAMSVLSATITETNERETNV